MKYLNTAGKKIVKKKTAIKIKLKNDFRSNEKRKKVLPQANIYDQLLLNCVKRFFFTW